MTSWHGDYAAAMAMADGMVIEGKGQMLAPYGNQLSLEEMLASAMPGLTKSGVAIGTGQALKVAAVFACRRVISEDVAKMPRAVKRRQKTGKHLYYETVDDHPLHTVITRAPNSWMTAMEFFEWLVGVAVVHEAAYVWPVRNPKGEVVELLPLLPGSVTPVQRPDWDVEYTVSGYGELFTVPHGQIFRLSGPPNDFAISGFSAIAQAREAVGLAAAIEASAARFHQNDLRPAGILTTDKALKADIRDAIRLAWQKAYGPGGTGGIAILDEGFKFQSMMAESVKNESIDNRKFQIEEICRYFRVIPTIIGHSTGSQSYASVEQMFIAHVQHTLHPWVVRLEQAMTRWLLDPVKESDLVIDVNMDGLLRGTTADRYGAYEKAVKFMMTPNEARAMEGRNPLDIPEMDRPQFQANNTGIRPLLPGETPPVAQAVTPATAAEIGAT